MGIASAKTLVRANVNTHQQSLGVWSLNTALFQLRRAELIVEQRGRDEVFQVVIALLFHLWAVLCAEAPTARERWARARLARGFSLDSAAKAVGASKRTLTRRLQNVLGKSPMSYFQSLRIERAVHLLKTSKASVDEIAAKVGYKDGGTLRLLLRRRLNLRVKEIRRTSRT